MGEIDSDLENFESKRARTRILIQRAIMKLTPAERGRWKFRLASLGLGVLAAGAVFAASLAVSDDLRLMYLVGVIVLFCGATWMGAKSWRDWLSPCLLYLPLAGMFGFFVLGQLPFLWPHLLLWALAIAIGLSLLVARLNRKAMISGVVILFAISVWYCMSYIPDRMKRATNHFGDGAAPEFAFRAVSEGAVPTTATPGNFVIDFFGTWCPPCIAELPEIVRVRAGLQNRRDIEFVVVGTNAGGDTPERLRAFARQQHVTLPLAFDQGKKAHAAFGLSGFPGIVVIDRAGRVRLTRQGYNSSEASFRSDLTQLLESL